MILTGQEIEKNVKLKKIFISPFNKKQLTTNSYDFRLDSTLVIYKNNALDSKIKNPTKKIKIPKEGYVLEPNKIYLANTKETMGSNFFVPIIRGKSSTGRIGLFVHITADLIDIGSINQYTLMLHATQKVRIYPDMLIGQVTFWKVQGDIDTLYSGKYNGLAGPQASMVYKDFDSETDKQVR